jgi:hypothetical protein
MHPRFCFRPYRYRTRRLERVEIPREPVYRLVES